MSSVRINQTPEAARETTLEWVTLRSPRAERPVVASPQGVVLSIAARRKAALRGERRSEEISPAGEYGGGDSALAHDIDQDVSDRWDD